MLHTSVTAANITSHSSAPIDLASAGLFSPQSLSLCYTAIIGTAVSVALECEALKFVSPREASVILTSEPLVASVGAAALLGERFDGWVGAALIAAASVVTFLPGRKGEEDE